MDMKEARAGFQCAPNTDESKYFLAAAQGREVARICASLRTSLFRRRTTKASSCSMSLSTPSCKARTSRPFRAKSSSANSCRCFAYCPEATLEGAAPAMLPFEPSGHATSAEAAQRRTSTSLPWRGVMRQDCMFRFFHNQHQPRAVLRAG